MIPKGLFTQIGMIIVAVAIIMTYVQPEFNKIGGVQDSISVYQRERKAVADVNAQLATLLSRLQSVSISDQSRLLTYMPDALDEISIQRDLLLITEESGLLYKSSGYDGLSKVKNDSSNNRVVLPEAHNFSLLVEGTYGQLKKFFSLVEQNNYPLEVSNLNITRLEGNFLSAQITFVTYTYMMPVTSEQVIF